jgi:polysaccharide biosynthesis transport protein
LDQAEIRALQNSSPGTPSAVVTAALSQLLNQLSAAQAEVAANQSDVSTVEPAVPASSPFAPQPVKGLIVGVVAGLLIACFVVIARATLDRRLRTADDVEEAWLLPLLGIVPHVPAASENPRHALADYSESRSQTAEAFRSIRTNVNLMALHHGDLQVVAVLSTLPSEWKSSVTANLAAAYASTGKRVLAISADLRAPALHRYFGLPQANHGLLDYLTSQASLEDVVQSVTVEGTSRSGALCVLADDHRFADPALVLSSPRMERLLAEARAAFDIVLIDGPPILAATEASLLARDCDGVMIVSRIGLSTRDAVRRARTVLANANARLVGIVVTDADVPAAAYGYGYKASA